MTENFFQNDIAKYDNQLDYFYKCPNMKCADILSHLTTTFQSTYVPSENDLNWMMCEGVKSVFFPLPFLELINCNRNLSKTTFHGCVLLTAMWISS